MEKINNVFNEYASFYDILYEDKNYGSECDNLEYLVNKFSDIKVNKILDLGCGTGGHSIMLAEKGYSVTGVELSKDMLDYANSKVKENLKIKFINGDIRNFELNETYDLIICMFAVLGYVTKNEDINATFQKVKKHLNKGGLFIFDVWYGPAVLTQKPEVRVKKIIKNDKKVLRIGTPQLLDQENIVNVDYDIVFMEEKNILKEVKEHHEMRYFFIPEIKEFAIHNGFNIIHFSDFDNLEITPSIKSWNITFVIK